MKKIAFVLFLSLPFQFVMAQNVTITPGGITPALSGTYPRISYDAILALPSPVIGDIAYDLTFNCLRVFTGNKWTCTYQDPSNKTPNIAAILSAGGTSVDVSEGIAVDASGNVYVTGYYQGTATFGPSSISSAGDFDIFVAKYNSSGTLLWVLSAGGTSFDSGRGIAVDASGNVYVTGIYEGTATFGASSISSASGSFDIFVAKYNSSGTLQWLQSAGGTSSESGRGIAVDASGNVYVTGYYQGTATFGPSSISSAGIRDIFVAKYNSIGTLLWIRSAGGTSFDEGQGIAVDASGNVYVTGYYQGTATFGPSSINSAGSNDIFVAKYNSSGTLLWVRSAGGTSSDSGRGIAVDASGIVYVTGSYNGTATFGPSSISSAGDFDIFVAKYNSSGTLLWVRSAGGASADTSGGIVVDASGNVYVTGPYQGTATLGASSISSAGIYDIFVAKYNSTGTVQWVQSAGGTGSDISLGIALDASGNVYVTGYYENTATFGASSINSVGNFDIFVARLDN